MNSMITLVKQLLHALLWDALAVRRWVRGFIFWLSTMAIQIFAVGVEVAEQWTLKQWVLRLVASGLAGIDGMINLGEKNLKPTPNP